MYLLIIVALGLAFFFDPRPLSQLRQAVLEHLVIITRCALPVGPGLRALADERLAGRASRKDRQAAELIRGLASRYEASGSLAAAFSDAPRRLLPAVQLDLLRVAEQHGALPLALDLLCDEDSKALEGRWRLTEWFAYPAIVGLIVLTMSAFQSQVILPKFNQIKEGMGLATSGQLIPYASGLLFTAFICAAICVHFIHRGRFSAGVVRALESLGDLVLWGAPFRNRRHGRWMQRAAALLRSGATLPEALEGSGGLRDVGGAQLQRAAREAREGEPLESVLTTALGHDAPRIVPQTILSSERSDSLGVGLAASGQRVEARAQQRLRVLAELLKPLPIVLCALVAATHIYAVWGAIISIQEFNVRSVW